MGDSFSKTRQKLKGKWSDSLTNKIDSTTQAIFPGYRQRYLEHIASLYRGFRGLGQVGQGVFDLKLEELFIEPDLTPLGNAANTRSIQSPPDELRDGRHTIWEYINANIGALSTEGSGIKAARKLVILGEPGSGKTTLLQHIALSLASPVRKRKKLGVPELFPVLLFLRDHSRLICSNPEITLPETIYEQLKRWQMSPPSDGWLDKQIADGRCLIMLDGLDDIANPEDALLVARWVEGSLQAAGQSLFLITSRPESYQGKEFPGALVLQLRPFHKEQIRQFLHHRCAARRTASPPIAVKAPETRVETFLRCLQSNPQLNRTAGNPHLLQMMADFFASHNTLPQRCIDLYHQQWGPALEERLPGGQALNTEKRALGQAAHAAMCGSEGESNNPLLDRIRSFGQRPIQEYLAANYLCENRLESELLKRLGDPRWYETIRLYCAQADASQVIAACLDAKTLAAFRLALECFLGAQVVQPAVADRLLEELNRAAEDPRDEWQHLAAQAMLERRVNPEGTILPKNDPIWIDTNLVSCAEYQLFIYDQRARGKEVQPEHWMDYHFPPGQANAPVLGVQPSNARGFCRWLATCYANEAWHFRLPTTPEMRDHAIPNAPELPLGCWVFDGPEQAAFCWIGESRPKIEKIEQSPKSGYLALAVLLDHLLTGGVDLELAADLAHARELTLELALSLHLSSDPDLAFILNKALGHAREINQASSLDQTQGLFVDLGRANNLARDLAIASAIVRARELFFDLDSTLTHARNLNCHPARIYDLSQALDSARDLILNLNRSLTRVKNLTVAMESARTLDCQLALGSDLGRVHKLTDTLTLNLDRARTLASDLEHARKHASNSEPDTDSDCDLAHILNDELDGAIVRALILTNDLDRTLPLDFDRNFTFDWPCSLEIVRARVHNLTREIDSAEGPSLTLEIVREHIHNLTENLNRRHSIDYSQNLALALDIARTITCSRAVHFSPEARSAAIKIALDFALLKERAAGSYPAFEGIMIVKESFL